MSMDKVGTNSLYGSFTKNNNPKNDATKSQVIKPNAYRQEDMVDKLQESMTNLNKIQPNAKKKTKVYFKEPHPRVVPKNASHPIHHQPNNQDNNRFQTGAG